ncbi:ATP-binding cassette domain-containing protein [bacterium]|nr:ATP-binding cassette domain-containing protein [bacterium]
MEPIIQVRNLTKTFKVYRNHKGYLGALRNLFDRQFDLVHAVDGVNFEINPGELVGYIGPNGAGKSTTIKMLTGLLVPTEGDLTVNGYLPWKQRRHYVRRIGAVFGQRTTLWWDLPLTDSLELLKDIYTISSDTFKANVDLFREILDLDQFITTPVRSLSLGQRMRADLCAAFLHNPDLVFLDEPTIGLDVVAKQRIREFIQFINKERNTTILLTTHDITDIAKLCERVLIIDHGKILFDGQLESLLNEFGGNRLLSVDFAEFYPDPKLKNAKIIGRDGNKVIYAFERQLISASKLINQLSSQYRIRDLEVQDQPIEDTIRRIYEEQLLYNHPYGKENSPS